MPKSLPYKGRFRIKYPFRVRDTSYAAGYHCGVDLTGLGSGLAGPDIYAIENGEIVAITTNDAYGNSVVQSLPDGCYCRYSHLSKILVKMGQNVSSGLTKIGIEGSTGRSTGPHLDIRISKYSYHSNNVNDFYSVPEYLGFPNTDELVVDGNNIGKEEKKVQYGILLYSDDDYAPAKRLCAMYDFECAIFIRKEKEDKTRVAPEIVHSVETLFRVGGGKVGHKNEIPLSGGDWFKTVVEVGKHMKKL